MFENVLDIMTSFTHNLNRIVDNLLFCHTNIIFFLKTEKTAGTSIEITLSRFCGPHNIVTSVSLGDEDIRVRMGYPGLGTTEKKCGLYHQRCPEILKKEHLVLNFTIISRLNRLY